MVSGNACSGTVSPAPSTNQPLVKLGTLPHVPLPTVPSRCDSQGLSAGASITMLNDGSMSFVTEAGNGSLNMPAGIYILQGGGLDWHNVKQLPGLGHYLPDRPLARGHHHQRQHEREPECADHRHLQGPGHFSGPHAPLPPSDKYDGGAGMNFNCTIYVPGSAVEYTVRRRSGSFPPEGPLRRYALLKRLETILQYCNINFR